MFCAIGAGRHAPRAQQNAHTTACNPPRRREAVAVTTPQRRHGCCLGLLVRPPHRVRCVRGRFARDLGCGRRAPHPGSLVRHVRHRNTPPVAWRPPEAPKISLLDGRDRARPRGRFRPQVPSRVQSRRRSRRTASLAPSRKSSGLFPPVSRAIHSGLCQTGNLAPVDSTSAQDFERDRGRSRQRGRTRTVTRDGVHRAYQRGGAVPVVGLKMRKVAIFGNLCGSCTAVL